MQISYAPPSSSDAVSCDTVRRALSAAGYTEANLCARMGVAGWRGLGSLGPWELLARADGLGPPLDVLLRLFRAHVEVDAGRAEAALGAHSLGAMEAAGLVARGGGVVRALVTLSPVGGLVFAADLPERHRDHAADCVLGAGGVTRRLADLTVRTPVDSALDLGCGAGILAGLAAAHARRVVATDVNPRAVAFSRFNAALNGLPHMECRVGSLFEPVRGERFDLIVCNPPYVISPTSTYVYRDGGTDICRAIVRGAARHLTPAGTLQMLAEWPEREGRDWREEVSGWIEGAGCDAWLLRFYSDRAEAYVTRWLSQESDGPDTGEDTYLAWLEYLRGRGITSVGGGLLLLRPASGSRPHAELRQAPPIVGPAGPSIERWLKCQHLLLNLGAEADLLDVVLVPPPELERRDRGAPTEEGWTDRATELRLRTGLAFGARVDPVTVGILGLLDGRRSAREALEEFALRHRVSPDAFLGGLPGAVRRLVSLGMLVPAG